MKQRVSQFRVQFFIKRTTESDSESFLRRHFAIRVYAAAACETHDVEHVFVEKSELRRTPLAFFT